MTTQAGKGVRGSAAGATPAALDISLYDEITPWAVRGIIDQLRAAPDAPVTIHINSPGGEVTEGFALANVIKTHKGKTTAVVEGICASAATFAACAADELQMHAESLLMVHAPWSSVVGGPGELEEEAEVLRKLSDLCVGLYQRKTKADEATVRGWMDNQDVWFKPSEAVSAGFCDRILDDPASPSARASAQRYLAMVRAKTPKLTKDTIMAKATESENHGIPDGGAIPEHLAAKLSKHGYSAEDPDTMMDAYAAYMESTEDPPAARQEMKRCIAEFQEGDKGEDEESSADKSDKQSAKLRPSAGLDPAVAKLVESLTAQNTRMAKRLDTFEASERKRAETEFYVAATQHTSREDAADYVAKCGGNLDIALSLIQKLPRKGGVMGRWYAGGSPVGGASSKDSPVERTKTIRVGVQTAYLHGYGLSTYAKKIAAERKIPIGEAQLAAARERPELLQ